MTSNKAPLDAKAVSAASPWGLPVEVVGAITSTNDELLRRGEGGAPSGTLLMAERQTAGRGQFQRPWESAQGLGLWFSLVLRLPVNDATIPLLSAFPAVALVHSLQSLGITAGIKAPNDILVDGRKLAGILVETRPGANSFAVIGIGLNVNHAPDNFPGELRERAISLAMVAGHSFNRNSVASSLITELGRAAAQIDRSPQELLSAWNSHLIPS